MKAKSATFNPTSKIKQRFGFRKLSVGLAAVALGSVIMTANNQNVQAATDNGIEQANLTETTKITKPVVSASDGAKVETPTSTQKTTPTDSTNTPPSTQNDGKDDKTANLKVKKSDQTLNTESLAENKIEDKSNDKARISQLSEPQNSITVSASIDNDKNEDGTTKTYMAGRDQIKLKVDINSPSLEKGTKLTVQIGDEKAKDEIDWDMDSFHINESQDIDKTDYQITNNGNGEFTIAEKEGSTDADISFNGTNFTLPLVAKKEKIKTTEEISLPVTVTPSKDGQVGQSVSANPQSVKVEPFSNKVQEDEIAYGFPIGKSTFNEEASYNSRIKNDYTLPNDQDDQTVVNYGVYFNYGKGGKHPNNPNNPNIKPLKDAIFKQIYSKNQYLLPSSIRVWQVPDDLVVNPEGDRYGINDETSSGKTVYQIITSQPEDTDFEDYLKSNLVTFSDESTSATSQEWSDPKGDIATQKFEQITGISFSQNGEGEFAIKGNSEYAKHAYFFQITTLLPKELPDDWTKPVGPDVPIDKTGPTVKTLSHGETWTSQTENLRASASGDQTIKIKKTVTETIKYVFEDENGNVITTTSRAPSSTSLTFNGTKKYTDQESDYTWTDDNQTFNAVTIAP
ncbi:MAG: YSIRK-type signal peptide-containing protein, partial [Lactobacillus sp.]|nr:YSIRK-type signal peptide-containing protein [Lactobacillus sp.]